MFAPLDDALFVPVLFAGSFGPAIAALVLIVAREGGRGLADFLLRFVRVDGALLRWLPFILLVFPALLVTGLWVHAALGGDPAKASDYLGGFATLSGGAGLLGLMLIGGPLSEEPGWRGYALDGLIAKGSAVRASVMLGLVWAAWHFPLFLVEGTSQHAKGMSFATLSWIVQILSLSLVMTLVHRRTGGSILAAILLHLMANMAYPLGLDVQGELVFSALRIALALGVVTMLARPRDARPQTHA
ncbi:CPBP family intramembrane glutamic endopeptidase [Sphingomicrobium nitratireducens]|uniref:CPBP family intramembrane glutamic endopeptidase n=1 Tax=Sphingomicrobium nitratireducens TaxID=2964666 RepID=UPI00223EA1DD|nr:CPBP family intramembrane glutamic endopeptidase [Sphingomicrobium nitratireducens]